MKKSTIFLLVFLCFQKSFAQSSQMIWLRSNPSNSTFRYVDNSPTDASINLGPVTSLVVADWTSGGAFYVWRAMLGFDLPTDIGLSSDNIDSAFLSLWADPNSPSGNPGNPTYGSANAVGIYRIVDDWDTTTISWDNQPGFAYTDGDTLQQSISYTENYLNTNVTSMVKNMLLYEGDYGFMLKHIQETTYYNSMIFYSPYEYPNDSSVTPLLVIYYHSSLGISNVNASNEAIDIYPNPTTACATIKIKKEISEKMSISIVDCVGKTLVSSAISDHSTNVNYKVDLSKYSKGIYIVRLTNEAGNVLTKKLVVD